MWSTCNFKKFDVNCCETVNVRPNLSENKILIYYNVDENRKAFLLSSNLQRNTEVHKPLTQICIFGTVLMVAVSASLTDGGNLSHFNLKSHNYSVPMRWILPTLYCKQNVFSVGNQTKWEASRNIFPSLPVLHIKFNTDSCFLPNNTFNHSLEQQYFTLWFHKNFSKIKKHYGRLLCSRLWSY